MLKWLKKPEGSTVGSDPRDEIYAVSRINPLYLEEKQGGPSPVHSSSGYESVTSDDSGQRTGLYDYVRAHQVGDEFIGAINGRNHALKIIEQNENYVKEISVRTNNRLFPISENRVRAQRKIPSKKSSPDTLGVAKILQRNKNYVQSIRIGRTGIGVLGRKPSVTFSEQVDVVDHEDGRRRVSVADSIVTESLLVLTREVDSTDSILPFSNENRITDKSKRVTYSDSEASGEDSGSRTQTTSSRRSAGSSSKSAFGGIADHYGAATEFFPVDAYSNGKRDANPPAIANPTKSGTLVNTVILGGERQKLWVKVDGGPSHQIEDQVPIYEILPNAARLHSEDDSDSGNSTDRNQNESQSTGGSSSETDASSKVMIVTGKQSVVIDLSAIPPDLRNGLINTRLTEDFIADEADYAVRNKAQYWDELQGKPLTHHPNLCHTTPDFTMDSRTLSIQARKVKNGKRRRCWRRIFGIVFFLASFIAVIITLSLVYTNGRKVFGSA